MPHGVSIRGPRFFEALPQVSSLFRAGAPQRWMQEPQIPERFVACSFDVVGYDFRKASAKLPVGVENVYENVHGAVLQVHCIASIYRYW